VGEQSIAHWAADTLMMRGSARPQQRQQQRDEQKAGEVIVIALGNAETSLVLNMG
jgi:hypothetical protein